ncbi:MAG: hypothetical protein Q8L69_17205, partial [Gallionellaceae bacterium]|nr:hypothetical protein [Gallionellaceae bacterium]
KGEDWAFGGGGDDLIDGGDDNDVLMGEAGNDILLGGLGDDILAGDSPDVPLAFQGDDWLDGGAGKDTLFGDAGDDVLIGGKGLDTIYGGAGRDTYIFNKGDGVDKIYDADDGPDKSIMVFGEGFDKNSITLRCGSLLLDMGNGDAIHIENWDQANPLATQTFASFQFADGSSLSWNELLQRGFDLDGTDGDDTIVGTGLEDRIDGRAGNDLIFGLDGNDTITGGLGTDAMNGGLGDDTYVFRTGDSATEDGTEAGAAETLLDDGGSDTIRFAAGIDAQNLVLIDNLDGSLVIDYSAVGQPLDRLLIDHGLSGAVENYKVGAGTTARTFGSTQFIGEFGSGIYSGTDAAGLRHLTGGKTADSLYSTGPSTGSGQAGATVSGGRGNDTLTVYGASNILRY